MRTFTKEEIEKLSVEESNFHSAVYSDYKRATYASRDQMIYDIYHDATGDNTLSTNWNCGICSYKLYKACGKKYFEDKASLELEEQAQNTETKSVTNKKTKKATNK